jgi:hypothetical protein
MALLGPSRVSNRRRAVRNASFDDTLQATGIDPRHPATSVRGAGLELVLARINLASRDDRFAALFGRRSPTPLRPRISGSARIRTSSISNRGRLAGCDASFDNSLPGTRVDRRHRTAAVRCIDLAAVYAGIGVARIELARRED